MKRLSHAEERRPSARIADEVGFTMVELLVAMLVSIIVIGGGVYGMARAFSVSSKSEDQATASSMAESGFERFVLDLRQAVNGTCVNGPTAGDIAVSFNSSSSLTTIQMCDPNPAGTPAGNAPPSVPVQWQCDAGVSAVGSVPAQTCVRSFNGVVGSQISGIEGVVLTGITGTSTSAACIAGPAMFNGLPTGCPTSSSTTYYTLNSGVTTSPVSMSWVGIKANVGDLQVQGSGQVSTVGGTSAIPFATGAELLNYGT